MDRSSGSDGVPNLALPEWTTLHPRNANELAALGWVAKDWWLVRYDLLAWIELFESSAGQARFDYELAKEDPELARSERIMEFWAHVQEQLGQVLKHRAASLERPVELVIAEYVEYLERMGISADGSLVVASARR